METIGQQPAAQAEYARNRVRHAEPSAVPNGAQAPFELTPETNRAQPRNASAQLQRDVARVSRGERLATSVRIARMRAAFAPGPVASAALW
jgi:hypothetical protein